jgi:hypothetical protein
LSQLLINIRPLISSRFPQRPIWKSADADGVVTQITHSTSHENPAHGRYDQSGRSVLRFDRTRTGFAASEHGRSLSLVLVACDPKAETVGLFDFNSGLANGRLSGAAISC